MIYATATGMLDFGAIELSQLVAQENASVTGALLIRTIEGGDRSAYTADEIAAADEAVALLNRVLERASRVIDSYLTQRYTLPLSTALVSSSGLPQVCMDIARFLLANDTPTDTITQRYDRALRMLRDLADGRSSLGEEDRSTVTSGRVVLRTGISGHDWDAY